jgi:5-methylcytosine-specific restriction endonuclease McrA
MRKRNYNDEAYSEFRRAVLKRDGRKCQMPDCGSKKKLNVHHIRRWADAASLRFEPNNGITLCHYCHKSISGQELHYEPLFMEIINAKKTN